MSFFSLNATNQQTHSTAKPDGLSTAADYSTTVIKNGREIITTKYIDLTGLYTSSNTTGVIAKQNSNSNNYLLKHREYDYGRLHKIEMIVLDTPTFGADSNNSNSFNVGLVYDLSDSKGYNESITFSDLVSPASWTSLLYKEDVSINNLEAFFYHSESINSYNSWSYDSSTQTWTSDSSHGKVVGDIVKVPSIPTPTGGGTAQPSEYVTDKNYFVVEIGGQSGSETTFKLSETEGGDPVTTSSNSNVNWGFNNYDKFLYLTGGNSEYSANTILKGKFLIKLYGHEV